MASFLPCEIMYNEEVLPARYLYAVATHPDYRGRSLAKLLVSHAMEELSDVFAVVTVPAGESLHRYYASQGFAPFSDICRSEIAASELAQLQGNAVFVDAAELNSAQNFAQNAGHIMVTWPENALAFQIDGAARAGGGALLLTCKKGRAWVLAERYEEAAKLTVVAADGLTIDETAALAHNLLGAEKYIIAAPPKGDAPSVPHSMIKWLLPSPGFAAEKVAYCPLAME